MPKYTDLSKFPKIPAPYFMASNPSKVDSCHGVWFYEDPVYGDGQALWAIVGKYAYLTNAWDAGDLECDSGIWDDDAYDAGDFGCEPGVWDDSSV